MAKLETIWRQESDDKHRNALKKRLTKKSAQVLFSSLKSAANEKDIENAWRKVFTEYYVENSNEGFEITSPENVDGFISARSGALFFALRLLLEFKQGTDLTRVNDRARIACQCIHYMHAFKEKGYDLPTVIVGADENQAFVLLAGNFYKYLERDYKWDVAPSSAYKKDLQLMRDLQEDANLAVYPFQFVGGNVNERYNSLLDLFDSIDSIVQADGKETYKVAVSPATIVGMFDEFSHIAFREPDKIQPVKAVNMFMQMLTGKNSNDYYFLPRNRNLYHLPGDEKVKVYGVRLETYLNHYDRNFTPKEIDQLTAIADRLIEADERRFKGDFWTPTLWAERADELLKETIADNYKADSLVWDCAAGVRNLTREFNYNELFISTYHEDEVYLGEGYNPEAKAAFQYDFLNDDVLLNLKDNPDPHDWKMPESLFNALIDAGKTNKRVVFYTNPPYGTATNVKADGTSKKGIAKSKVNELMVKQGIGKASQQMYCQFFARIVKLVDDFDLKNVYIGFFTKPRFFAGGDYFEKFNQFFFSRFKFVKGNLLNAGEFSDTANTWPITFAVYQLGTGCTDQSKNQFTIEQSDYSDGKAKIDVVGMHTMQKVYNNDALSTWVREPLKQGHFNEMTKGTYPQLGSALNESRGKKPRGRLYQGSLGYMVSNSNNIGEGTTNSGVWLVSGSAYKANGFNVMPENFDQACVNFTARRAIAPTWYNEQDNYHAPDTSNPKYQEFVNDALVFTLFENASYQAAYRDEDWSNTNVPGKWANQWFWLPISFVKEHIENDSRLSPIYDDLRGDQDRFVAKEIAHRSFSSEAQAVLNMAEKVWLETLPNRAMLFEDYPKYYLEAWDAGWFQIKQVNHLYPADSYEQFRECFDQLKKKVNQSIYDLGMLNK